MTRLLAGSALTTVAATLAGAETWDMPMACPATNYHTENGVVIAECEKTATHGGLKIAVHPGGSLFAGNDIKRAVQSAQAPIGECLLSAHANENPMFGVDSIPSLATSLQIRTSFGRRPRGPSGPLWMRKTLSISIPCHGRHRAFTSRNRSIRPPIWLA